MAMLGDIVELSVVVNDLDAAAARFTKSGLPVGLQIAGRWRDEAGVLRAAAAFETAQPWADRRPPDGQ